MKDIDLSRLPAPASELLAPEPFAVGPSAPEPFALGPSALEPSTGEPSGRVPDEAPDIAQRKPGQPVPAQPMPKEIGGPAGPEPTRYGDWEQKGRCTDF